MLGRLTFCSFFPFAPFPYLFPIYAIFTKLTKPVFRVLLEN